MHGATIKIVKQYGLKNEIIRR